MHRGICATFHHRKSLTVIPILSQARLHPATIVLGKGDEGKGIVIPSPTAFYAQDDLQTLGCVLRTNGSYLGGFQLMPDFPLYNPCRHVTAGLVYFIKMGWERMFRSTPNAPGNGN